MKKVEDDFLSVDINKDTLARLSKDAVARKLEDEA
ncbi:MAG: hypothetical protein U9N42_07510 [Campylobacterota bacterium]|nr:hypothetical protein [Campylobacterota bacterium]